MFLHVSVILSAGGCGRYTPLGRYAPQAGTPPGRYTPLGRYIPWAGTPPLGKYTPWAGTPPGQVHPLGRYTPWHVHLPGQVHPPRVGTPSRQVHPQGRYTPLPGRRSTSGRYASYWNAILFIQNCTHTWIVPAASRVYLASPGPIDAVTAPGNASCATRC